MWDANRRLNFKCRAGLTLEMDREGGSISNDPALAAAINRLPCLGFYPSEFAFAALVRVLRFAIWHGGASM
jgi:hypothetical protein